MTGKLYIVANQNCCPIILWEIIVIARGWIDGKGEWLPDGTYVSQTDTFTTAGTGKQAFLSAPHNKKTPRGAGLLRKFYGATAWRVTPVAKPEVTP
jgi:hypothetical protein